MLYVIGASAIPSAWINRFPRAFRGDAASTMLRITTRRIAASCATTEITEGNLRHERHAESEQSVPARAAARNGAGLYAGPRGARGRRNGNRRPAERGSQAGRGFGAGDGSAAAIALPSAARARREWGLRGGFIRAL